MKRTVYLAHDWGAIVTIFFLFLTILYLMEFFHTRTYKIGRPSEKPPSSYIGGLVVDLTILYPKARVFLYRISDAEDADYKTLVLEKADPFVMPFDPEVELARHAAKEFTMYTRNFIYGASFEEREKYVYTPSRTVIYDGSGKRNLARSHRTI